MITGRMLKNALISGANNLQNHRTQVDALNVFPVPDGDTGTNMSQTCGSAVRELQVCGDGTPVGEIAKKAANALLRGARGNSGVILSLIFRGVSKGFKGLETADGRQLAAAFQMGQESGSVPFFAMRQGQRLPKHRSCCPYLKKRAWWTPAGRAFCTYSKACAPSSRTAL